MHVIPNSPYSLIDSVIWYRTNLSLSAYFFPCNISIIFIATGLIMDSPIVCGLLALTDKYDSLSTFFWSCCVLFYQHFLLAQAFKFPLEKLNRFVFKFLTLCSHISLQFDRFHANICQNFGANQTLWALLAVDSGISKSVFKIDFLVFSLLSTAKFSGSNISNTNIWFSCSACCWGSGRNVFWC
jgi:hypothetical protein